MKVRFYLKRPQAKKETAIFALASYAGNSIKIYTKETILPKFWNPKTQTAKTSPAFPESPEFNQRLINIRAAINDTYLRYINTHNNQRPDPAILKSLIEKSVSGEQRQTFVDYFAEYVDRTAAGQRIVGSGKSKRGTRQSTAKGYGTTLKKLRSFERNRKTELTFESINHDFYEAFNRFLVSEKLSLNTIGSHFQRIKAVMASATEKGINSNLAFRSRFFAKHSEEASAIYLNPAELRELKELDLKDSPRLDNARDLFLIGCYTGLRFSDFSALSPDKIKDGFIRVVQLKTGMPVIIPVHAIVSEILLKRAGELPRTISNQKLNDFLKEIGQRCTLLQSMDAKTITKGGIEITTSVPKWKLLTTHTARRSFASNEFSAGTPTITLMAITGHKTEKAFLKYIRVKPEEHAQRLAEIWSRRNNLKAV